MTFLPIVERELRVASRRALTWWTRLSAALVVLVLFGGMQVLIGLSRGGLGISAGQIQFMVLKWIVFVAAGAAGVFLTSDALSEEKREGTLGLLFLTDLRGYDVVLGKLLSHSLRAFYGLLAVLPVLALTILNGGVNGAEFFRVVLVICNTLFFSLSLGLLVSSLSRDSIKAMSGAALLGVVFLLGLPMLDSMVAGWQGLANRDMFCFASPAWLFSHTGAYSPVNYWFCLGIQQALAWACLIFAGLRLPWSWQEKAVISGIGATSLSSRWRFGGRRARDTFRRRWLDRGPVLWLALRDRWLSRLACALALLVLVLQGFSLAASFLEYYHGSRSPAFSPVRLIASLLQQLLGIGLTLWVAAQASRLLTDSLRNGALELLLVTPVTPREIVGAQWQALWRTFLFPALCILLLQVGSGMLSVAQMKGTMPVFPSVSGAATNSPALGNAAGSNGIIVATNRTTISTSAGTSGMLVTVSSSGADFTSYMIISLALGVVTFLAGLAAVAWFGMWMGLTSQRNSVAVLKTVCFVFALPWVVFAFVQGLVMILVFTSGRFFSGGGAGAYSGLLLAPLISAALNLVKDAFFISWSRHQLLTRFRETVAAGGGVPRNRPLRIIPPIPPVVGNAQRG